ncbi:hypothetical protein R4Z10_20115 [Niallia sp. XMNu-256]|uniref:hypothetical protein n=1 Tax=Niallia sp. XMNu-256 TaxID=3082444 RepID=UPI0030CF2770
MNVNVRSAKVEDLNVLTTFLEKANVNKNGIKDILDTCLIMEDEHGAVKATLGMERFGVSGLLRSLVMTADTSEHDLLRLFQEMFLLASQQGVKDLYLATNKLGAMRFVEVLGFEMVDKDQLPMAFAGSDHVKHILTVDNSVFLKRHLALQ